MVVNLKKIFFLSVLVLMLATISQVVLGADSQTTPNSGLTANLTGIVDVGTSGARGVYKDGESDVSYDIPRVEVDGIVIFLKNSTYEFNISIYNHNSTGDKTIDEVNIYLPDGLKFIGGSNATATQNSSIDAGMIFHGNTTFLNWSNIGAEIVPNASAPTSPGLRGFLFNATVNTTDQAYANFTIKVLNGTPATGTWYTIYLGDKIYLDGIPPTFDSAKTNDTQTLNLTFSEAMNRTTLEARNINITYTNRSGTRLSMAIAAFGGLNESIMTLRINGGFEGNLTPKIVLNHSVSAPITDLAGNAMLFTSNTTVDATDGAGAFIKHSYLNISGTGVVTITLLWSEPVRAPNKTGINGSSFNVTECNTTLNTNFLAISKVATLDETSTHYGSNVTEIVLTNANSANVSRWRAQGYNISVNRSVWQDASGNQMLPAPGDDVTGLDSITSEILSLGNDTVSPTLSSWSYSAATGQFTFVFTEFVETSVFGGDFNLSNKTVSGDSFKPHQRLEGETVIMNTSFVAVNPNSTGFSGTMTLNVTTAATTSYLADKLAQWDRHGVAASTLYLRGNDTGNLSFLDPAGNGAYAPGHGSAKYLAASSWSQDSTDPYITSITLTDANVTGPGLHSFVLLFNENMTNTTNVRLSRAGTNITPHANHSLIHGGQRFEFAYNFTTADTNTEWVINISGGADLSGNTLDNTSTGLKFTYDSVAPYILYAYYINNGTGGDPIQSPHNGTPNIGDHLVLVMSEPMQSWKGNLSTNNFTFRDDSDMGSTQYPVNIEGNQITIVNNFSDAAPNVTLRGEWIKVINATALQGTGSAQNNRNLTVNNTQSWFIRDKADNFARQAHNTAEAVVVADYAVEVTNNTAMTISFPACINTGNMTDYLGNTDYSIQSYYNTTRWVDESLSTLQPLVGYRFTWQGRTRDYLAPNESDNWFRVYLKNQTECDLTDLEVVVKDGWNFLAINGNYYSSSKNTAGRMSDYPDTWLGSLSGDGTTNGIQVNSLTKDYGNGTYYSNGGVFGGESWDTLIIKPYEAWWVQSTSDNTFTGIPRT